MDSHSRLLVLVPLGFIAGVTAAGLVLAVGLFGVAQAGRPLGMILFVAEWMAILGGLFAFIPWTVAVILSVLLGFRSAFYWLGVGGGIGAGGYVFGELSGDWPSGNSVIAVHLLAGLVGGLLYWLIGARSVGSRCVPLGDQRLD